MEKKKQEKTEKKDLKTQDPIKKDTQFKKKKKINSFNQEKVIEPQNIIFTQQARFIPY